MDLNGARVMLDSSGEYHVTMPGKRSPRFVVCADGTVQHAATRRLVKPAADAVVIGAYVETAKASGLVIKGR